MKKKSHGSNFLLQILAGVIGLTILIYYLVSNQSFPTLNIEEYLRKNTIKSNETVIQAPGGIIKAEIATSSQDLERGLSGRVSIDADHGMLFVFPEAASRGFWMRNMFFPIDIIWIDKNKTVIGITKDVDPDTYPNIFFPPAPVRYVLELNAGYAEENGIASGTPLTFTI